MYFVKRDVTNITRKVKWNFDFVGHSILLINASMMTPVKLTQTIVKGFFSFGELSNSVFFKIQWERFIPVKHHVHYSFLSSLTLHIAQLSPSRTPKISFSITLWVFTSFTNFAKIKKSQKDAMKVPYFFWAAVSFLSF